MAIQDRLSLRNIYLYLVCLITLIISIFAAVQLVRNTVELVYPDPGYYGYVDKEPGLAEQQREELEQQAKDSQRRMAVLGLVTSGTTLLIAVPVYAYHWRRIQKELPAKAGQPTPTEPPQK